MSYLDAYHDREKDIIHVVERRDGKRVLKKFQVPYRLYYKDKTGKYTSVFGDKLSKYETNNFRQFKNKKDELEGQPIFESDCNTIFRCLAENYKDAHSPVPNIGFFDIEVDFDPKKGFSKPSDPYAPVNAISVYLNWAETLITLAVPPANMTWEEAQAAKEGLDNVFLFEREYDLLDAFFDIIDDVDILSGWNSTGYDIPYLVNRVSRVMGDEHLRRFCLWNQRPKERTYLKFKKEHQTFDLVGRVHLDYLELYEKYTYSEIASRKLDYVGNLEVGETKVAYEGTLDKLYTDDFRKFLEYNRQDTMLLDKLDRKLKFIDLSLTLAVSNGVVLQTTMGSVALIDQAIVNECHARGYIVFDKRGLKSEGKAAGAFVKDPVKGRHRWIGAVDINSLYPSVIRSVNMSPDTVFGQLVPTYTKKYIEEKFIETKSATDAWHNVFGSLEYQMVMDKTDDLIQVAFERGETVEMPAHEIYSMIFEEGHPLCMSGNGTLFRTDNEGIIPGLLSRWYSERKTMQAKAKGWKALNAGFEVPEDLLGEAMGLLGSATAGNFEPGGFKKLVDGRDAAGLAAFILQYGLEPYHGRLVPSDKEAAKRQEAFWDQRQLARKILLNSLYGAILNEASRFFDPRVGQSVTLTGRCITRHMISKLNEIADGEYTIDGRTTIYGDTDSCYFSLWPLAQDKMKDFEWTVENVVKLYDDLGDQVNDSFPDFMDRSFNTGLERGGIIKAGREIVAGSGLYIKKKRYAALVLDTEGVRHDVDGKPGKIKAMGVETQRSDTPKFIQGFLKKILELVLTDKSEEEVLKYIEEFRYNTFRKMSPWQWGRPTTVNGLTAYVEKDAAAEERLMTMLIDDSDEEISTNMPGHHKAAINWNKLREWNKDVYSLEINDGAKVIVCDLLPNEWGFDSIARPVDQEEHALPEWFKSLPFDSKTMERKLIDDKLGNLIGILDWNLQSTQKDTAFAKLFGTAAPQAVAKPKAVKKAPTGTAFGKLFGM